MAMQRLLTQRWSFSPFWCSVLEKKNDQMPTSHRLVRRHRTLVLQLIGLVIVVLMYGVGTLLLRSSAINTFLNFTGPLPPYLAEAAGGYTLYFSFMLHSTTVHRYYLHVD